ncbi:MAG: HAMP domain-containing sensor histidine kinase, partial [bacterium]|nr:HAMP domain-containing sensor histidine kinase [bacterium]
SVLLEHAKIEETKTQIIHIVSHEIKSPIATAELALANIEDEILGPLTQKQKRGIEIVRKNLDRLNRIAGNLLDIGRLESGKTEMHPAPFDMERLIAETVKNMGPQIEENNLKITADIAHPLPKVFADANMIAQVLTNLIGNALRFAKSRIIVRAKPEGTKGVRVGVEDDGPGIPKDRLGDLFQRFVQINRPVGGSHYKGTGLGLAIAKEIIRLNKGAIRAESEEGKGTLFYFTLPAA